MARSKLPLLLVLAVVTAAVSSAWLPSPASAASDAAAGGEYCRDSLSGLLACRDFMFGGAAAASPACCAAYSAAFDADPFCLCYIADGVYGRSTGYDVNVTHALEIPVSCGPRQAAHRALQHARSGASSLRAVVAAAASISGEASRVSGGHAGAISNGGAFAATGAQAVVPAAVHFAVATAATAAATDLSWSAWCDNGDRYGGCCGGHDDLAGLTILGDVY
ncbi:hypothetical protein OsJ_34388 [Oryza sativa Japonica Group]|uniref:Bifunctional inhibitor/plant lipid transfer protein/seed storage helical domain-containing protein n=1 Tax=Oryza sativa subsp. japonica TaxID=39947 RepID=A3CCN8_ORYSJ|nr:hypothetical protein OsJ_34388 [Oryza sativa Japonica Group]